MIADLWPDGHIDCKDYALRNAQIVRRLNETPTFVLTPKVDPKHIFVVFRHNGVVYVLDNDRMYRTSLQGHLPVEE